MASLKKNIFWNSIRIGSNLIFPMVTFPYVSRIMGPNTIGLFNYIMAISGYFTLFAALGFPIYGIREVAQNKDSKERLQSVTNAIFTANLLSCILVFITYLITSYFMASNSSDFLLYFILGLSVLLSCVSFDWFYQGIEDFKYITIRSLIIKAFSIVSLFLFVKNSSDIIPYAILTIVGTCGNNILNLIRIKKYIHLKISFIDCWKHTRGASILFLGTIVVSLYSNLNTVMIGALGTMLAVAYFTTANRLIQLCMTILGSITSAVIPRIAYLVNNGTDKDISDLQKKSLNIIYYISIPMLFGIIALANPIIRLFGGNQFMPAAVTMKILSSLLVIISLSGFLGNQVLIPLHKEKYGNYCVLGGAITNLILNYYLIPSYGHIGVAIAIVCAEIVVTVMHFCFTWKYINLTIFDFIPVKCIISSVVMFIFIHLSYVYNRPPLWSILWIFLGAFVYFVMLFILKDKFLKSLFIKYFSYERYI